MANETYSPQIMEHLEHPRNKGAMDRPDAVGVQGNPVCGDTMKLMLRIGEGSVIEARWQTVGCQPALATSSLATELVVGMPIDEVEQITSDQLLRVAGGLPQSKLHCAAMAAGALHKAIAGYRARQQG